MRVGDTTLLVGIVGRLVPIKNHILFLDMAEIFLKENIELDVKFVVIGDGELRKTLEALVENKGLRNHVRFCGWRQDLPEVYADLNILALTSENEGTPVSIIEAMGCGYTGNLYGCGGCSGFIGTTKHNAGSKGVPGMQKRHSMPQKRCRRVCSGPETSGWDGKETARPHDR